MTDPQKLDYASPKVNAISHRRRTHPVVAVAGVLIYGLLTLALGVELLETFHIIELSSPESPFKGGLENHTVIAFTFVWMLIFGWRTTAAARSLVRESK